MKSLEIYIKNCIQIYSAWSIDIGSMYYICYMLYIIYIRLLPLRMTDLELIETNIHKIFDGSIFYIEIIKTSTMWDVIISSKKDKDVSCLMLKINIRDKLLRIINLDRCDVGDEGKGTAMMRKINDLALSLPEYNSIKLTDVSYITLCDTITVKLAHLKILTKGMSWYNSHGYFSEKHEAEVIHNNSFITSKIHKMPALRDILQVDDGESSFPKVKPTDSIQVYVSRMLKSIETTSTSSSKESLKCSKVQKKKAENLKTVVELLSPLIIYENKLSKTVR